ncbi:Nif3-like dinuclear metal center hexameric protein [Alicyclobacillus sp.]|uniref:Nif3-like dinuclear metal center hexameric protein n=1 Tax=Alicyclobacillus sp. TaxID=61169 RepID=UPI0025BB6C57|nr:Nif3-like dinuclear metal center hexameric protein [Alicyclobacillus sp.]MCL6516368.1 Nif3-like dinuclear metal center hexameric protein [Alicyclobacillus sp.]
MADCTIRQVVDAMHRIAPPELAMDKDVIGLQIGRMDKPVRRIRLALDAYPAAIEAAVAEGADLLITHHALLFRPLRRIDTGTARGRALALALAHDLAVFNAHTNLDIAEGGVNDVLADRLGLTACEVLERTRTEGLRKLVVFVPESHHEAVLQAVCAAGAGHIGAYSHCTFNTPGTGTFLPLEGARPYLGEVGRLERADEIRLETIVPESKLEAVVRAMLEAHPYEEVAYDVYPLQLMGRVSGIGRVGGLSVPMRLGDFAEHVRRRLGLDHIRFSGDPNLLVERVAVLGGSGGRFARSAMEKGAQVLVTSDCDHHTVAEAWQDGLAIIDATHAALERPVLEGLRARLAEMLPDSVSIEVLDVREDPFHWI